MKKVIGYVIIAAALFIAGFVLYKNSTFSQHVPLFSPYTLLSSSWEKYKDQFITPDGRVIDPSQGDITTSEGQSYAMLRAVWIDDHDAFDSVWHWTKPNLQRKNDHLFGWKWGKRSNGTYGFMENGGDNSASDADVDIALALLLASARWDNVSYKVDAMPIIHDIWNIDTVSVKNKRYLLAGNWANENDTIIMNPSYFAPYAWRLFAKVDKEDDWNSLIKPAYSVLFTTSQLPLNGSHAIGLPPDWVAMDRTTGRFIAASVSNLTTNYSFDAMRIPWRIDVDYRWYDSSDAYQYLRSMCSTITHFYKEDQKLSSVYAHSGIILNKNESPAIYGAASGCFDVMPFSMAQNIYQDKIVTLYSNTLNSFNPHLPYYDQNWIWFGAALENNAIINFLQ